MVRRRRVAERWLVQVILTVPTQYITAELVHIESSKIRPVKRPLMMCVSPFVLASHIDEAADIIRRINRDSRLTGKLLLPMYGRCSRRPAVLQLETMSTIKSALIGTEFQRE